MEFCLLSHCTKSLVFTSYRQWPSPLPAIAWKKHLLCGFDRNNQGDEQVINFEGDFSDILKSIYPELSLTELARLFSLSKELIFEIDRHKILKNYNLNASPDLISLLEVLPKTPVEFQDFVHLKKIGPRELSPLRALTDLSPLKELLLAISLSTLSKSQAVNILEWTVELYLMEFSVAPLLKSENENSEAWLERISSLRMPLIKKSDQEFTARTSSLAWPSQVRAEWVRKGDQAGLQISLFATSQIDFNKKLLGLNKIRPEELWTNS